VTAPTPTISTPHPTPRRPIHGALGWIATPRLRSRAPVLAVLFSALLSAALVTRGQVFGLWDQPLQRLVEAARTAPMDQVMLGISRLGSTPVVIAGSLVLAAVAARRNRAVAIAVLLAAGTRPLIEWTLKEMVDRPRPQLHQLVPGTGPSFPSGHVLAAIALWCLLPAVVALYTHKPDIVRRVAIAGWAIVVAVAASRVYLGVHWTTDVTASLLLGPLHLIMVASTAQAITRPGVDVWSPPQPGPSPAPALIGAAVSPTTGPEVGSPITPPVRDPDRRTRHAHNTGTGGGIV
jgi:membrane-associated phospholipid phosphatase